MLAVKKGRLDIVQLLVAGGAKVNVYIRLTRHRINNQEIEYYGHNVFNMEDRPSVFFVYVSCYYSYC